MLALTTTGALELTAYATLLLAMVTGALATATFVAVRLTKDSLAQTQVDIGLSRQEVEEAHRPVLVGLADHRRMSLAGPGVPPEMPCKPRADSAGMLTVPIENVGTGPALLVEASVRLRNDEGGPAGAGGSGSTKLVALRADGRVPLLMKIHGVGGGTEPGFELEITYEDVAKRRWRTLDIYVPANSTYQGPSIEPVRGNPADVGALE
jgi:hypothetical protein